jgi:hypothetical protein
LLLPGCAIFNYNTDPPPVRTDPSRSAMGRALDYLEATQVREPVRAVAGGGDWPGNWPQYIKRRANGRQIRDVSPFIPAFILESLCRIEPLALRGECGLDRDDVPRIRDMRERTVGLLRRFEASRSTGVAGSYSFWPSLVEVRSNERRWLSLVRGDPLWEGLGGLVLRAPCWRGNFGPVNAPQMPRRFAIPADADTTATVWGALIRDDPVEANALSDLVPELFTTWRDLGGIPLRFPLPWLERPSGLFLTYIGSEMNDVDLVVNANVLHTLARCGRLDVPGVEEAVAAINSHAGRLTHECREEPVMPYYVAGFSAHYLVSRAYAHGGIPALRPAVDVLLSDVVSSAQRHPSGFAYWDRGSPDLDTALAVLTLANGDSSPELVCAGALYLLHVQDRSTGGWRGGSFFAARTDSGIPIGWHCPALTTALAMEALATAEYRASTGDLPAPP